VKIVGSGVFWPLMADPLFRLVGVFPFPTSDHRAVWADVKLPLNFGERPANGDG
jgi:hypothetical protein